MLHMQASQSPTLNPSPVFSYEESPTSSCTSPQQDILSCSLQSLSSLVSTPSPAHVMDSLISSSYSSTDISPHAESRQSNETDGFSETEMPSVVEMRPLRNIILPKAKQFVPVQ